jgi:hypothetical protein
MSLPTDPSHPLVQQILNAAVASRGGWSQGAPTNTLEAIQAFIAAVDWQQPFFLSLLCFHLCLLLLAWLLRHSYMLQLMLLGGLLGLVSASENLNSLCKQHWRSLTSEDYFDSGGIFASLVWASPLALIAFITVVRAAHSEQLATMRQRTGATSGMG